MFNFDTHLSLKLTLIGKNKIFFWHSKLLEGMELINVPQVRFCDTEHNIFCWYILKFCIYFYLIFSNVLFSLSKVLVHIHNLIPNIFWMYILYKDFGIWTLVIFRRLYAQSLKSLGRNQWKPSWKLENVVTTFYY